MSDTAEHHETLDIPEGVQPWTGRRLTFSPQILTAICERMAKGEPLAQICRDEDMPGVVTVWNWERKCPGVAESIAQARKAGYDMIAVDALRIADNPLAAVKTKTDAEGGVETTEGDAVDRARLMVETRLKLLSKWDRDRYGEQSTNTTVNVGVQVNTLTESQRAGLLDKKRAAIDRRTRGIERTSALPQNVQTQTIKGEVEP